ncbi:MHO_1590 family protein [Mesomycoplasma neurolyticum]|uniref:Membrane protein n=1 Tax=Mesomycoplasma neurolyticum TaxID=2120 RepID=A0A449A697_9BACT|nr:hypothetical protein [Mesomycoplasma neurolyticum]VEU59810.1 membrane protein [Mesomycoplasma neurolyticum]
MKLLKKIKFKLFDKKKLIFFSLSILVISSITFITIYFVYNNKNGEHQKQNNNLINNKTLDDENSSMYSEKDIFPEVNPRDYYELINVEKGVAIIDENFVSFFVKDIIKRLGVSFGDIKFYYKFLNKQNVKIEFVWIFDDEKVYKNYYFKIENGIIT